MLQQLPVASLTHLQLLDLDIAEDEAAELKPVAAALRRLTGDWVQYVDSCCSAG
jgi:hypothetical protein